MEDTTTLSYTDDARVGLIREILQVLLGLEPEVEDRVMNLLKGSVDAQDVKTPEMRQRIGNRAMKYLSNAIDLARNEGSELHNDDQSLDVSKQGRGDIEPGHKHDHGIEKENAVTESKTFKSYLLNELNFDVDLDDKQATNDALMKIKRAAQQGSQRASLQNVKDSREKMDAARDADPSSPTKQLDIKIANLSTQLAQLQKRRSQLAGQQQQQGAPAPGTV